MIYAAKRCCLILKAFGTVQHSIFCYNYIQSTSLNVLYAIYMSRERSDQSCQCSMILEEGRAKLLTSLCVHITMWAGKSTWDIAMFAAVAGWGSRDVCIYRSL